MPVITSDHKAHAATCNTAEMNRQAGVAVAIAAGGGSAAVASAIKTAEIAFYRSVIVSAVSNGLPSSNFNQALRDLGTGGS